MPTYLKHKYIFFFISISGRIRNIFLAEPDPYMEKNVGSSLLLFRQNLLMLEKKLKNQLRKRINARKKGLRIYKYEKLKRKTIVFYVPFLRIKLPDSKHFFMEVCRSSISTLVCIHRHRNWFRCSTRILTYRL